MKDLMDMLMKKKGQPQRVDATEKMAKMQAVKELITMLEGMMGEEVDGGMMKKVTVAAPDDESLEMGLEKAKEVVSEMPDEDEEDYE
jgi:hypothetical protein